MRNSSTLSARVIDHGLRGSSPDIQLIIISCDHMKSWIHAPSDHRDYPLLFENLFLSLFTPQFKSLAPSLPYTTPFKCLSLSPLYITPSRLSRAPMRSSQEQGVFLVMIFSCDNFSLR